MAGSSALEKFPTPTILPLGDGGILVRFGPALTDAANRASIALAIALDHAPIAGVIEVVPNLISVLLRYDPLASAPAAIAGELRLRLFGLADGEAAPAQMTIPTRFDGPDIAAVADLLGLSVDDFILAHNAQPLRVLGTGFAPGFVYCGLHPEALVVPRRTTVRAAVPPGSVLFAAGQTAIAATEMPTGWHLIGQTDFRNFDPAATPPTRLGAGDTVRFEALP